MDFRPPQPVPVRWFVMPGRFPTRTRPAASGWRGRGARGLRAGNAGGRGRYRRGVDPPLGLSGALRGRPDDVVLGEHCDQLRVAEWNGWRRARVSQGRPSRSPSSPHTVQAGCTTHLLELGSGIAAEPLRWPRLDRFVVPPKYVSRNNACKPSSSTVRVLAETWTGGR